MRFSQNRWMGAKTLQNAGYKLPGTVAPLIAMDGMRYQAETRLLQILEEKHIDDPEKLSIEWKSKQWNIMLIFSTFVLAILSGAPYFALLCGSASWRPSTHTPWIFPLLRTAGSCLATICCQYLIQTRVISIMKNRLLFMTIHRHLIEIISKGQKEDIHFWVRRRGLRWDKSLPSEDCLWNLEQNLYSNTFLSPNSPPLETKLKHLSIPMGGYPSSETNFKLNLSAIQSLRDKHFPSPIRDSIFIVISWILLLVSLPATVSGYIGCFTLVSSSKGNGPLVWLGLEAALSIIRILIWAWNPKFDEETEITVKLNLTEHRPLITTGKNVLGKGTQNSRPFALFSQRRFLEWITPYTGPLDEFRHSQDVALYFALIHAFWN